MTTKYMYLKYTRQQRSGILLFFTVIIALQFGYFFSDTTFKEAPDAEQEQWLALQPGIEQQKIEKAKIKAAILPFNPNYISDFKGYQLGMTPAEIDRLLDYRKTGRYVNSPEEFQQLTQISDSLLQQITPLFKFPDWRKNKKKASFSVVPKKDHPVFSMVDINTATQEELMGVKGIGPALSKRILEQKEVLGAFAMLEQLEGIRGLSAEVIRELGKHFKVMAGPPLRKININTASLKELALFPYFSYPLSKEIVTFRSMNNGILNIEDLTKINGFPVEKLNYIALYLEF
ncbi:ComEA family DNA-binding protein [Flavobacterium kingsejongi]|uniref:Competence protein ComEA n=1 Tax=Flavobacterium kingsejongi TaxID=1678728 RepID=A0A2S1LTY0_9FLAO|nr:helix-hairpin-helix domain-containing protein [Flavobacterium kingsejongi]AWG27210.1 hypothetical protein FK004_00200 [Flavobacterium kingsejongi]